MYTLKNKQAIDFYNRHPHIDFDAMNGVFVSILENLMTNLSDKIDNSQNTFLLKQLSDKLNQIEQTQTLQINEYNKTYQSISSILHTHTDRVGTVITKSISPIWNLQLDTI